MSDKSTVRLGGKSQEEVALELFHYVCAVEGRELFKNSMAKNPADRRYILDTFVDCQLAARGVRTYGDET